jgi:hypothetical protein
MLNFFITEAFKTAKYVTFKELIILANFHLWVHYLEMISRLVNVWQRRITSYLPKDDS